LYYKESKTPGVAGRTDLTWGCLHGRTCREN